MPLNERETVLARQRDRAEEEANSLREEKEKLLAELQILREGTYCAFCGQRWPLDDDTASAVTEHIKTCKRHPMRVPEREASELRERVRRLTEALKDVAELKAESSDFYVLRGMVVFASKTAEEALQIAGTEGA